MAWRCEPPLVEEAARRGRRIRRGRRGGAKEAVDLRDGSADAACTSNKNTGLWPTGLVAGGVVTVARSGDTVGGFGAGVCWKFDAHRSLRRTTVNHMPARGL